MEDRVRLRRMRSKGALAGAGAAPDWARASFAALAALRVREDAEEVAQDAFIRAWRALDRFRGDSSFRTWILRIAWNRAISRRRTQGRRR